MKKRFIFTLFQIIAISLCAQTVQIPAFPGAEGGGMYATGGRGGFIYYVNTLEDTNDGDPTTKEGSLRWCINQTYPRIILFKVSGTIMLNSRLDIQHGNVTIAGQSAPGDGICLGGNEVTVNADNVIIRYMRFRMGDINNVQSDALWGRYHKNIIIDHCSMSWSVDECSSFYENENFTMQWCILSESLRVSKHDKGSHGYGGVWGGKNASFHHNLLAHHDSRNPRFAAYSANRAEGLVDFRNNVIYNWGGNSGYGGEGGNYNMVNNYYQPSPTSSNNSRIVAPDPDQTIDPKTGQPTGIHGIFYVAGNRMMNTNGTVNNTVTNNNWLGVHPNSKIPNGLAAVRSDTEFACYPVTTHSAEQAYALVLDHVGASLSRDTIDKRVIDEVRNRKTPIRASGGGGTKAGLIDSQNDVGGWCDLLSLPAPIDANRDGIPDDWFDANVPAGSNARTKNEAGYTYVEVYLNSLVEHITENQIINSVPTVKDAGDATLKVSFHNQQLKVSSDKIIQTVQVYNIFGQLITNKSVHSSESEINLPVDTGQLHIIRVLWDNQLSSTRKIIL